MQVRQGGELPLSVIASVGLAVALAAIAVAVPIRSGPTVAATTAAPTAIATSAAVPAIVVTASPVPASARPTNAAFAMTVSDAELTKAAAGGFPQTVSGVTMSDPVVNVMSSNVRLVAKAKLLFGSTQFVMTATPLVADGQISVRVDSATLAGMSLPDSTKASIASTVQSTLSQLVPANVRVTGFAFAPGALTVQGTRN
jgi:hypothetical protein